LAVGPTTDGPGIIDALQSGAREYLDAERLETALEAALQKIRSADTVAAGGCRVVSFLSATGGCGVTTAATNVAVCWARKDPGRVALAELGGGAATLALNLDIEPRFGTAEVTTAWERMDASFLRQSLTAHGSGVQVLAQKVETVAAGDFEPAAARKMVLLLRTMAAAVALDLGHRFGPEHFEAMRLSDRLALVVRLEVPALRQARSLLQTLEREGVPRTRVALIANRYGQRGQLPWKKAEEALGTPFLEYLPEDVGGMNHALNHGKPLVQAGGGSLARRFSRLADKLTQT
jgi:pilus assembly protein CpaE